MQQSRLSCQQLLKHQLRVLVALLQIQLPAHVPEKVEEERISTWAPASHVGDMEGIPGCAAAWSSPSIYSHLRSEPLAGRLFFFSLCISISLCHSAFLADNKLQKDIPMGSAI